MIGTRSSLTLFQTGWQRSALASAPMTCGNSCLQRLDLFDRDLRHGAGIALFESLL